jgi:hypothetical protein
LGAILVRGNDLDPEQFGKCMSDDVEIIYAFGSWRGVDEHKRRCKEMKSVFTFTQHVLTNPIIEVNGDKATASWYVFASHGWKPTGGKDVIYAGAIYNHELARTPQGWRITRHHCETLWYDDPKNLMKQFRTG